MINCSLVGNTKAWKVAVYQKHAFSKHAASPSYAITCSWLKEALKTRVTISDSNFKDSSARGTRPFRFGDEFCSFSKKRLACIICGAHLCPILFEMMSLFVWNRAGDFSKSRRQHFQAWVVRCTLATAAPRATSVREIAFVVFYFAFCSWHARPVFHFFQRKLWRQSHRWGISVIILLRADTKLGNTHKSQLNL